MRFCWFIVSDSLVHGCVDKAYWFPELRVQACRRRDGMQLECQESWECLPLGIRPVSVLHLEVAAGNVPAQALYAGLGFVRVGHRPGYYADGSDAWLLRLNLCAAAAVHPPG